jgi:hypothetical protein
MPNDALTIVLLHEAFNAPKDARRVAARLLLDILWSELTGPVLERRLEKAEAVEALAVADELRALIDQYRLRRRSDL